MLLIDQHVAHERILFDKFRKLETGRKIESQNLLLPETIDLTPAQSEAFQIVEPELESLGFGLMRLSGRTVAIKSVPTDLPASEVRNLLAEILDTVDAEKRGDAKTTLARRHRGQPGLQGGRQDQYEIDPGEDAMADRPSARDLVADHLPARPAGDPAAYDEGYRARLSQNVIYLKDR